MATKSRPADVSERAEKFAETLAAQQALIDEGCRILKHMSKRFEAVRVDYEPIRVQSLDLTTSQANAERLKDVVSTMMDHLKAAEKLRQLLRAEATLDSNLPLFLTQLAASENAARFFLASPGLEVSTEAISDLKQATAHGYRKCGQMIVRALRSNMRSLSKADLDRVLATPPAKRPGARDVYITNPAMPADVTRLIQVMLAANEMDCLALYCSNRQEHLQTVMRVMGAQIEGIASSSGAPSERRVDEWTQVVRLLAQLIAWESELVSVFVPASYSNQALLRAVQNTFDSVLLQGFEFCRGRGQPEKTFQVLQMMACLRADDVAPLFAKALGPPELQPLAEKVQQLLARLHEEGKALTSGFTETVANDASPLVMKDITSSTSVAPQTAFAMRFLKNVFKEEVAAQLTFLDSPRDFALKTIKDLQHNLEARIAPAIKDRAAAAIFMLNNVNYVRVCIEEHSFLLRELGPPWSSLQMHTIKQWKDDYIKRSWEPLLAAVQAAALEASPQMKKDAMKEHFKKINARIEKLQEQSLWSMHDTALRTHVRSAILEAFLPNYQDFWNKYQALNLVKDPRKYFKYSPMELQEFINQDLFSAKGLKKQSGTGGVPKALKKLAIELSPGV